MYSHGGINMGSAFNAQERSIIIEKLKEVANEQARTVGMKKTTVEELAKKANISKGAFYHFYPSKEHLFFEILIEWHEEMMDVAMMTVRQNKDILPASKTASLTIYAIIQALEKNNVLPFIENDLETVIRKIPVEKVLEHGDEDYVLIEEVVKEIGAEITVPVKVLVGLLHTIFYTMANRPKLGEEYPKILETLVEGVCEKVFID